MTRSIVRWSDPPAPRVRLLCIAHAGAGAGRFRAWLGALPPDVALWAARLPGRESRALEPPLTDLDAVLAELLDGLDDVPAAPLALFGHCSGAIVAFALARALAARGAPPPCRLLVAGQVGPSAPEPPVEEVFDEPAGRALAQEHLGRDDLDDDLAQLLAAAIEADRAAIERFDPAGAPIATPITAFVGADDPLPRDHIALWADATRASFASFELPGDHLLDASWLALAHAIAAILAGESAG
jgi:surfactin synthase thioesterase subunit